MDNERVALLVVKVQNLHFGFYMSAERMVE